MVRIICVCEKHLKFESMDHCIIPCMPKVVFYWWVFYIFFVGASCVCVPFHWGFHITLFTFQEFRHMCMCYVHNLVWHFIFTPMSSPHEFTPNPHLKRGFLLGFGLDWLWFGNSTHTYTLEKMCTYNIPFLH